MRVPRVGLCILCGSSGPWTTSSVKVPANLNQPTNRPGTVMDMELSALNGGGILTACAGQEVTFLDAASLAPIKVHKTPMHFREEGGASLHPQGGRFVAGGSDLWVRVFDFATGQELECHKGHHGPVRVVVFYAFVVIVFWLAMVTVCRVCFGGLARADDSILYTPTFTNRCAACATRRTGNRMRRGRRMGQFASGKAEAPGPGGAWDV